MKLEPHTNYLLQAYVDDELDPDDIKRVEMLIAENVALQKKYNELIKQKNLLQTWWSDFKKKH